MSVNSPRAVYIVRETDYDLLLARHGTREQARFFLETRGQKLEETERRHREFNDVLRNARAAIPSDWRQALAKRADLDRFLFGPEDVIIALGPDGLVANVAKYLTGQPVLGVNPAPDLYDGVLVGIPPARLEKLLPMVWRGEAELEQRTMVEAVLDNGERLLALNEIFVGHRSHQSARYHLAIGDAEEDHSSSGLIVASGTGVTGWARSIMEATGARLDLAPAEPAVAYFVREPFPSIATGTSLRAGKLSRNSASLNIISRMNEGGTIFADGMEQDHIAFDWGRRLGVSPSSRTLNLVRD